MILNSLVSYYENLLKRGELAKPGWNQVNVSYALCINEEGQLEKVVSLRIQNEKKMEPRKMQVPEQVKRSISIMPNFMCDNSQYFLGICEEKNAESPREAEKEAKKKERAISCFEEAKKYHEKMLKGIQDGGANAVRLFFGKWNPHEANNHAALKEFYQDIVKSGNLVFLFEGRFVHETDEVKSIWDSKLRGDENTIEDICLVTGKRDKIAKLHPSIKGIRNAQASGASLVSFNAASACSYGKEQGMNAQTGEYATRAYTSALNYLIEKISYKQYLGDTAVLCYATNGDRQYQSAFDAFLMGTETPYSENELNKMITDLCAGRSIEFEGERVDPNTDFNVLGISPNAARLAVRFYYHNSFGKMVDNIHRHCERLEIVGGDRKGRANISLWMILKETCREGSDISAELAGELIRAIMTNARYPTTLINALDIRIRADHKINDIRAGMIKAYYLRNTNYLFPKEVLTVALNKETQNVAYNLGRLFAILERVQKAENPSLNATIRDKFFGSASATPAAVFPHLIELSQKHMRKLKDSARVYFEKQIGAVMDNLCETGFPRTFNMQERGAFQLGYYHQTQELFKSKNVENGGMENE